MNFAADQAGQVTPITPPASEQRRSGRAATPRRAVERGQLERPDICVSHQELREGPWVPVPAAEYLGTVA
jgi:hypothetical protein